MLELEQNRAAEKETHQRNHAIVYEQGSSLPEFGGSTTSPMKSIKNNDS
jgi:hypothetical protein